MKTKIEPRQRLAIYKEVLEHYLSEYSFRKNENYPFTGLCYSFKMVLEKRDPEWKIYKDPYYTSEQFPEILRFQPDEEDKFGFWFQPENKEIRVKILTRIINELEQCLPLPQYKEEERLKIYQKALLLLFQQIVENPDDSFSICACLDNARKKLELIPTNDRANPFYSLLAQDGQYPEVEEQKPHSPAMTDPSYWFVKNDFTSRVTVLIKAIEKLKK